MSKVKVGDLVRCLVTEADVTSGSVYTVVLANDNGGSVSVNDDAGDTWWLAAHEYELAHSFHPNDTVRLKSGEPFTTGSYTAEVDSVRSDIVLLKHGSWLPVDAVEKVGAWLPEGDGWIEYTGGGNPAPGAKVEWLLAWERRDRKFTPATATADGLWWSDKIVAYRVVEPAPVPAAEPAAETKPKFKVGDRVRVNYDSEEWTSTIVGFEDESPIVEKQYGWPDDRYGDGYYWCVDEESLTLISPAPVPASTVNLTLSVDTSSLQADLADQFQRIADALRAA